MYKLCGHTVNFCEEIDICITPDYNDSWSQHCCTHCVCLKTKTWWHRLVNIWHGPQHPNTDPETSIITYSNNFQNRYSMFWERLFLGIFSVIHKNNFNWLPFHSVAFTIFWVDTELNNLQAMFYTCIYPIWQSKQMYFTIVSILKSRNPFSKQNILRTGYLLSSWLCILQVILLYYYLISRDMHNTWNQSYISTWVNPYTLSRTILWPFPERFQTTWLKTKDLLNKEMKCSRNINK